MERKLMCTFVWSNITCMKWCLALWIVWLMGSPQSVLMSYGCLSNRGVCLQPLVIIILNIWTSLVIMVPACIQINCDIRMPLKWSFNHLGTRHAMLGIVYSGVGCTNLHVIVLYLLPSLILTVHQQRQLPLQAALQE